MNYLMEIGSLQNRTDTWLAEILNPVLRIFLITLFWTLFAIYPNSQADLIDNFPLLFSWFHIPK